jgi:hypothetical protein
MNPLNNYRFAAYALLAIGLLNLRYQSGSVGNLSESSILITTGAAVLGLTFIPKISSILLNRVVKLIALIAFALLIAYSALI